MSPPGPVAFLDGIGFSEMLLIGFIAILVFGGRLPDVLRNLGRGYAKFRQGLHDVSRPIRDEIQRATTLAEAATAAPATLPTGPSTSGLGAPAEAYAVGSGPVATSPAAAAPSPWPSPQPSSDPGDEPPPV